MEGEGGEGERYLGEGLEKKMLLVLRNANASVTYRKLNLRGRCLRLHEKNKYK